MYKTVFYFLILIIGLSSMSCTSQQASKEKILIFSETKGFRHSSITIGKQALRDLFEAKGFAVDTSENSEIMTPENLEKYAAVVFLSTTGDIFNEAEEEAFKGYIQNGGGFVGIHSATDTEYEWEWYGKFIGGYFESHPKQQDATIQILDNDHPATQHLPKEWLRWDEWYNYKNLNPDVNVLANLDETSYEGGTNGDYHPISWYQEYDGGKMFYTGLGHTEESFAEEAFMQHVWGGIEYVIQK